MKRHVIRHAVRARVIALATTTAILLALGISAFLTVGAASAFASPAFQTQWQQGEAIVPNFWGPLATAHDGQMEPYASAPGGQRLVQYFDKARMELTNPSTGVVTNGLLATELVTGQLQVGDSSFQPKSPPAIAVAGDPSTTGATYAALATTASVLLQPAQPMPGIVSFNQVNPDGTVTNQAISPSDPLKYAAYDDATKHNVPQAFAQYRDKVGLLTIGYAISEPFQTNVLVGGKQQYVTVEVFERRVLTYTAANPDPFKVEFGNIGQHYYTWRYSGNPPPGPTPAPPTPSGTPTPALVGPVWQWQQTQLNDGSVTTVNDPSRYTITFMANGALAVKADCNQVTGTYQTTNTQLTITLGPATLAACPPDSQADTFVQQLGNVSGYVFSGSALILNLKFDSGGMRFGQQVNVSLVGTAWTARGYNNGKGGFTTPLTGTQLTILFGADGTVSGKSGCNTFTGPYQMSGTSLTIGPLVPARSVCAPEIIDQEQAYLAALAATKSYRIAGTTLTLLDAGGVRMAEFTTP